MFVFLPFGCCCLLCVDCGVLLVVCFVVLCLLCLFYVLSVVCGVLFVCCLSFVCFVVVCSLFDVFGLVS